MRLQAYYYRNYTVNQIQAFAQSGFSMHSVIIHFLQLIQYHVTVISDKGTPSIPPSIFWVCSVVSSQMVVPKTVPKEDFSLDALNWLFSMQGDTGITPSFPGRISFSPLHEGSPVTFFTACIYDPLGVGPHSTVHPVGM